MSKMDENVDAAVLPNSWLIPEPVCRWWLLACTGVSETWQAPPCEQSTVAPRPM